jgi:hypothetical protein
VLPQGLLLRDSGVTVTIDMTITVNVDMAGTTGAVTSTAGSTTGITVRRRLESLMNGLKALCGNSQSALLLSQSWVS